MRAKQQEAVARLGQRALLGAGLDELMEDAARLAAGALAVEHVEVLELQADGQALRLAAGTGWKEGVVGRAAVGAGLDSQAGYTLQSKEPVIVSDLRLETRFRGPQLLLEHNVVSGMTVAIHASGMPYGVLGAHTTWPRRFTRDDVHFLQGLANVLGAAVERKRYEAALQTLNASLEKTVAEQTGSIRLMRDIAVAMNDARTAEAAFAFVLERICAHTGWPAGRVLTPDGSGGLVSGGPWRLGAGLDLAAAAAFQQARAAQRLAPSQGLPGAALAAGRPLWLSDLSEDDAAAATIASAGDLGLASAAAFPVQAAGETAAVLEFFSAGPVAPDPALREVMEQAAAQLGRFIERRRAEAELRRSQAQLAEAQKLALIGSWDWDPASNQLDWSEEMYRIYGRDPAGPAPTYESYLDHIHPADRRSVHETVQKAMEERASFEFEHRIVRPDGQERILYAQGKAMLDEDGRLLRYLGVGQDITRRRRIEDALSQSIVLLESLFESSPDGAVLVNQDGRMLRINRQIEAMFGYSRDELAGEALETLLPERFRSRHLLHRQDYTTSARQRPMGAGLELLGRRKDGSEFPVDILLSPVQTDQASLVIAVVRDITERRKAEESLRQSEARFRAVFEAAAVGIAAMDLDGRILVSNDRMQSILGRSAEELRGALLAGLLHPADAPAARRHFDELARGNGRHTQAEQRFLRSDGETLWGNHILSIVRRPDGSPEFVISMLEDITARKQMAAELAEVQHRLLASREMERVQLAQELHDSPLQDLYGILYQLNTLAVEGETAEELQQVEASLNQVIRTLRALCGELRPPSLAPYGLEGAIRSHSENFRTKHPEIELNLALMDDGQALPEEVRLNMFRIYQQAMNNVLRHAQATRVEVRLFVDAEQATLEVEDNGRGFEVPQRWIGLAREGHLGLVGAAERAELFGGVFRVTSRPGEGTLVRATAPRA